MYKSINIYNLISYIVVHCRLKQLINCYCWNAMGARRSTCDHDKGSVREPKPKCPRANCSLIKRSFKEFLLNFFKGGQRIPPPLVPPGASRGFPPSNFPKFPQSSNF
jgi:hypothetical protein